MVAAPESQIGEGRRPAPPFPPAFDARRRAIPGPASLRSALAAAVPFLSAGPWACALFAAAALPAPAAVPALSPKLLPYVCYSPYRDGQAPGAAAPTEAQIRADLAQLAPYVRGIRTYSVAGIQSRIPALAREAGLEVYAGAWIGRDEAANLAEVDTLIALAKAGNPALKGLIVGNEVLLRGDAPIERLLAYLKRARDANTGIPVSTADIYQDLIDHAAELGPAVDFALCHAHPYWEAVSAGEAAARVAQAWSAVKAKYPGKPVLVGETGFPTAGQIQGAAVPGEAAQAVFLGDLVARAAGDGMTVMWFDAFDEAWKGAEGPVGAHWGLWNADRSEKPAVARLRALTVGLAAPRPGSGWRSGGGLGPWEGLPRSLRIDGLGRLREAPPYGRNGTFSFPAPLPTGAGR
jgi:exo-beta-1,3-glucanase (GH17 family)